MLFNRGGLYMAKKSINDEIMKSIKKYIEKIVTSVEL
jgi:hypothetical protein